MVLALLVCCGFFSTEELPSEGQETTAQKKQESKLDDVPAEASEPDVDRVIDRKKALAIPNERAVSTSEDQQALDEPKFEIQVSWIVRPTSAIF